MTPLLEHATALLADMPAASQDEMGRRILRFAADRSEGRPLTVFEEAAGAFATDEEVREVWTKRGL